MKRIYITLIGLLLYVSLYGQILRFPNYVTATASTSSYPAVLDDGDTFVWYIYTEGITKDGSNYVSEWQDQSGNDYHLTQATSGRQPLAESTGITFDGAAGTNGDRMSTGAISLAQPQCIYIVFNPISWIENACVLADNNSYVMMLQQEFSSNNYGIWGSSGDLLRRSISTGSDVVVRAFFNGASSKLVVNGGTAATGTIADGTVDYLVVGGHVNYDAWANVRIKEIIIRNNSDSAGDETAILDYLNDKYSIY